MMVWEKAELENLKAYITKDDVWTMNIKLPEGCGNETCPQVQAWVGPRGVSDDAANMQNFMVKNTSNVSLSDVNTNLDVFDKYEKEMIAQEPLAAQWVKILMMMLNGTVPMDNNTRRVLAEENLGVETVPDTDLTALAAGEDAQLDTTELADVDVQIDQTEPTEAYDAVDNVSDADSGTIGDDSDMPVDGGSDSGTSFMTWVMYIGGAILVLALIAGVVFVLSQNKDAEGFSHDQQDTQMTTSHI